MRTDEQNLLRFGIYHPVDLLDMIGHLLEALLALAKGSLSAPRSVVSQRMMT